jgi:hypothetical protein
LQSISLCTAGLKLARLKNSFRGTTMRSRNRIIAAAASVVTILALVGCGESYVSDTSDNPDVTVAARPGRLETWPNNYSYSRPETSVYGPQPAGAHLPGTAGSSQLDLGPPVRPEDSVGAQPSR